MALQVWLPLNKNGNLKNQGLADVTVTNNGATYNASGKIGGCYNIGNNKYITSILDINSSPISASCWIYLNSFQGSYDYIISLNNNGGYADQCIAIALESTTKIVFCVGGNSSCLYNSSETLVGKWTHLAVTFDGSKIKGYLNGVEVCSYNSTASLKRSNLTIGCRNGNTSYYTDCKINDVRIYNHCLSPKEIKELSKGLVLHYTLDELPINRDLLNGSRQNTYNSNNEYINLFDMTSIIDTNGAGKLYTVSFDAKADINHSFNVYGSYGSNPKYSYTSSSIEVTTEWQHFSKTFTPTLHTESSTWSGVSLYGVYGSGAIIHVRNIKFELGNAETPFVLENQQIHDSSGYNNNGTIIGTLTTSTDTPRYDKCTNFQSNSCITTNNSINGKVSIITVSAWAKRDSWTGDWRIISCTQGGGWTIYPYNDKICWLPKISGEYRYVYSLLSLSQISAEWHHFVATWDGNNAKLYIDGELLNTVTVSNGELQYYTSNAIFIGAEAASDLTTTQGSYFNGLISDVRIYATALSANDVKELYNTAAFINHKGNIGCYLFYEDADSQITKTGQVKTEEFEEISDLTDGVAKVYELKIECNQLIEI